MIRIDHAIARADGPLNTPDSRADLENVKIFKANGDSVELNIANPAWKNGMEDNEDGLHYLEDRDLLFVPTLAVAEVQGRFKCQGRGSIFTVAFVSIKR